VAQTVERRVAGNGLHTANTRSHRLFAHDFEKTDFTRCEMRAAAQLLAIKAAAARRIEHG